VIAQLGSPQKIIGMAPPSPKRSTQIFALFDSPIHPTGTFRSKP
jgi:hypothetical protein